MAYDEGLAQRIRELLEEQRDLVEKKMFGGIAFMVQGNLCCGVLQDDLIVRIGPDGHAEAMARPYARVFDITGRPMKGWVLVGSEGCESDEALEGWVRRGLRFALSLPAK